MSGRKRKKEEKAKTQLKKPKTAPGKHLPKGTNVTKTEFKVAKINIPGQKNVASQDGPVTSKRIGLTEVLSKLSHFSMTVKTDGLEGLKDLLSGPSASDLVLSNLAKLVGVLMPLTHEVEKKLRKLCLPLLTQLFSHTPASALTPLYSLISAHLGCSLTHLDPRIQRDGLALLDILLDHASEFVNQFYLQILPNCLDQISAKQKEGSSGPHVAANLSENMTALHWRLSVLTRVDRILDIAIKSKNVKEELSSLSTYQFTAGVPCPISPPKQGVWIALSSLTKVSSSSSLMDQIVLLFPLMFETWVEARASDDSNKLKTSLLSKDTAELLNSIAGVIDKLVLLADSETLCQFKKKYLNDLRIHFFKSLPYHCSSIPCEQANSQLCSVRITLEDLDLSMMDVMVKTVVSKGRVQPKIRCRLLSQLLKGHYVKLTDEHRDKCIESLVTLVDTEERETAVKLLKEQAIHYPNGQVIPWVESLPNHIVNKANLLTDIDVKEKIELEIINLLNICLDLAKTKNLSIAKSFSGVYALLTGVFDTENTMLKQKLDWIKFHTDRTLSILSS